MHRAAGSVGKQARAALIGMLGVGLWIFPARAGAQVDQANDATPPNLFNSIQSLGPIGQEFVPAMPSMNFADLFTLDLDDTSSLGVTLLVNIRSGTITGPVVGTSDFVTLSSGFIGVTGFFFSTPVPLTPGSLYVLEAVVVSGEDWAVGRTDETPLDTYSPGRPIILGDPEPDGTADLWFRQGTIPEPSTLALWGMALPALAAVRRRRRPRG